MGNASSKKKGHQKVAHDTSRHAGAFAEGYLQMVKSKPVHTWAVDEVCAFASSHHGGESLGNSFRKASLNGEKLVKLCAGANPVSVIRSKLPDVEEHELEKFVANLKKLLASSDTTPIKHQTPEKSRSSPTTRTPPDTADEMTRVQALKAIADAGLAGVWAPVDFDDWCDDIEWSSLSAAQRRSKLARKLDKLRIREGEKKAAKSKPQPTKQSLSNNNNKSHGESFPPTRRESDGGFAEQCKNSLANSNSADDDEFGDFSTATSNKPKDADHAKAPVRPEPESSQSSAPSRTIAVPAVGPDLNSSYTPSHSKFSVQQMHTVRCLKDFLQEEEAMEIERKKTTAKRRATFTKDDFCWHSKDSVPEVLGLVSDVMKTRHVKNNKDTSADTGGNAEADAEPSVRRKRRLDYKTRHEVRVFMSSTFRDFAQERDYLFRFTFPQLENRCNDRGLFFVPVDLRWGVTEEECTHGDVIKLCLQEIDESYPFFVCMLGERYGWHQQTPGADKLLNKTFDEAAKYFPWVEKWRTASATEMEVRHAVLNYKDISKAMPHTFFYMRDAAFAETVPEKDRGAYYSSSDFAREKLKALKREITERMPKDRVKPYSDIPTVCKQIADDIWASIEKDFPDLEEAEDEDAQEMLQERHEHDAFAARKLKVFVPSNKGYMDVLDSIIAKAKGGGASLMVVGANGTGKTALVANWVHCHKTRASRIFFVEHYICSTQSNTSEALISRLLKEMLHHFKYEMQGFEFPKSSAELVRAFPSLLEAFGKFALSAHEVVTIVIDNLTALDADHQRLEWLPDFIPPGVCVVLTSTVQKEDAGQNNFMPPSVKECQKRHWQTLELLPMDRSQTLNVIEHFFDIYGKKLSDEQEEMLLASPNSRNPQFLLTVLEELRSFGIYEKLGMRIKTYLAANTLKELFELIITQRSEEYGRDLVRKFFSLLACTQNGLTEDELCELLKVSRGGVYASFRLSCRELVFVQNGRTAIRLTEVRDAVHNLYNKDELLRLHGELATFMTAKLHAHRSRRKEVFIDPSTPGKETSAQRGFRRAELRLVAELGFQLEQWGVEHHQTLSEHIAFLPNFYPMYKSNHRPDLLRQWRLVKETGKVNPLVALKDSVRKARTQIAEAPGVTVLAVAEALGDFFEILAEFGLAEMMRKKALTFATTDEDTGRIQWAMSQLYFNMGRMQEATECCQKAQTILNQDQLCTEDIATLPQLKAQLMMANLAKEAGRTKEALEQYDSIVTAFTKPGSDRSATMSIELSHALNDMGNLHYAMGALDRAQKAYRKCLELTEEFFGPNSLSLAKTLHNMAMVMSKNPSRREKALTMLKRSRNILEQQLGDKHPEVGSVLGSMSMVLCQLKRVSEGVESARRAHEIQRGVFDYTHDKVCSAAGNLAQALERSGTKPAFEEALRHYGVINSVYESRAEMLHTARLAKGVKQVSPSELDNATKYARCLVCRGRLYIRLGQQREALECYEKCGEVVRAARMPLNSPVVQTGMRTLAKLRTIVHRKKGR